MPRTEFQDINRCLHFPDNWDKVNDVDWDNMYLDKKYKAPAAAKHQTKFTIVEDACNKSWKLHNTYGKEMIYDKSRVAGWYPRPIVMRP